MQRIVKRSKTDIKVRNLALSIVRHLPPKDFAGQARACFYWVRDNIRYVGDVSGVETIHTPEELLKTMQGDCDDKSIMVCALLESIGHKTRFLAIGRHAGQYSHVLAETRIGNSWFAMETTENYAFGQPPPGPWYTMRVHN